MTTPARFLLALGLVALAAPLAPVTPPSVRASAQQAAVPVTVTLRLAGGRRQFRPGEIIPIELTFSSPVLQRYVVDGATYDRSGRLTIDEFRVEPNGAVTDPMLDYFASNAAYIGGGIRSTGVLGEKPYTVSLELNDWFRFDTPGTYTLSVRSERVRDEDQRPPNARRAVPVESNSVSFEVLTPDAAWEAAQVARAIQILSAPPQDGPREPRTSCRTLRFLATDAAVDEMIRRYDDSRCGFDFMAGLFSAPNRERVVRQMEAGLRASDQAVTSSYLRTLAVLSVYAAQPELRAAQTRDTKGRLVSNGELARRPELMQATEAKYADIVASALPAKTGRALAVTAADRADHLSRRDGWSAASPDSSDARRQLVAAFEELPAPRQRSLLEYRWQTVAHSDMLPVLRRLADGSSEIADLALRRLHQLDPDEGRARILRQIQNPPQYASLRTLGQLPDRELPELDGVLAENVEKNVTDIGAALLHRYASPAIATRVLGRLGSLIGHMACQPQSYVLAYFLRVAPGDGRALLNRVLASRADTGCFESVLRDTAALHMTPAIEAAAIAHLDDPHLRVVHNAIETLGRHGSGAALEPLRAHFEAWHRQWQGRPDELRHNQALGPDHPGATQALIENAYLQALVTGQGWLSGVPEIEGLRALCVTESCRIQANFLMGSAGATAISIGPGMSDLSISLAQYRLTSVAALEDKIAQYPEGSVFTLNVVGLDPQLAERLASDLVTSAASRGYAINRN